MQRNESMIEEVGKHISDDAGDGMLSNASESRPEGEFDPVDSKGEPPTEAGHDRSVHAEDRSYAKTSLGVSTVEKP